MAARFPKLLRKSSGTCIVGYNLRATLIYRFLVIKCPGKDSFKDFAYLLWKGDRTYTFKTTHEYYFQMVGQMGGVTGMKQCDYLCQV